MLVTVPPGPLGPARSAVVRSTAAARRRTDGVGWLTAVVVLAFGLPSRLVYPPMGAAGRPALLLSVALLLLWGMQRLIRGPGSHGPQPLRVGTFVFGWTLALAYAVGLTRGMPSVELRASDRYMILIAGLIGLALWTADGINARDRLDVLLKRVTYAAAGMSLVGLIDFATGRDLVAWIRVPGLSLNAPLIDDVGRGGFSRVASTATHPIEFGVVLGMVLPVAVHYVLVSDGARRRVATAVAVVIAAGIPVPVARSAVVAAVVGMLVLSSAWSWRRRLNAALLAGVGLIAYSAAVPSLLGTVRGLFLNASTDGSVEVRTEDYDPVLAYVRERPWFGRGPGTFLPDQYRQLDNQVLKFALEIGVIGLVVVLAFLLLGAAMSFRASTRARRTGDAEAVHLARALAGSILAGIAVCATFDSFSYQIYATVLFVFIGAGGALWRLCGDHDPVGRQA